MFLIFALIAMISIVAIAIKVLIFCRIFSKAGYSWALGLLVLVPIVNVVMAFYLAFADWPVCKEIRQLREQAVKAGV
jgi:hypothetical protein